MPPPALYPWAPVRLLMKNRYDSLNKIGRYPGPAVVSHGTTDDLVPHRLGRELYDAIPGPEQFVELPGGHNDEESPEYYEALDSFLASLPSASLAPHAIHVAIRVRSTGRRLVQVHVDDRRLDRDGWMRSHAVAKRCRAVQ